LTGVFDALGAPLPGGIYTNAFTILTCDVSGDDQVTPLDVLIMINHLNGGLPYDPVLDVDWNGVIDSIDSLLIINFLNAHGNVNLVAPGEYRLVPMVPPSNLVITGIRAENGEIMMKFFGLPEGSYAEVMGKASLLDPEWYEVLGFFVTNGTTSISFPMLPSLAAEFYRASFR
jgi:hypothetical protein